MFWSLQTNLFWLSSLSVFVCLDQYREYNLAHLQVSVPGVVLSGLYFSAQFPLPLFFQSIYLVEKWEVLNGEKGFFFVL